MHHKPNITQEEKLTRMTESPLPGLIFSLAVPTIGQHADLRPV